MRGARVAVLCATFLLARGATAKGPRDLPSEDKAAPPVNPDAGEVEWLSFHFQMTAATQAHPRFSRSTPARTA